MIYIVFPPEIKISNLTLTESTFVGSSGLFGTGCKASFNSSTELRLLNCYESFVLSAGSIIRFSLRNITNPVSLQPTSSFKIYTMTGSN